MYDVGICCLFCPKCVPFSRYENDEDWNGSSKSNETVAIVLAFWLVDIYIYINSWSRL